MKTLNILGIISLMAALLVTSGCAHRTTTTTSGGVPIYGSDVISALPPAPTVTVTTPTYPAPIVGQGAGAAAQVRANADAALATAVRQAFGRYSNLSAIAPNIQVSAQNGTVTLTGNVPTEQDRNFIENVVRSTPGVVGINDELQVPAPPVMTQPTGRTDQGYNTGTGDIFNLHVQGLNPTDRTVAQNILQGLQTDQALNSLLPKVDINVANGRVILQGMVQNQQQKNTIASAVERAAGAGNVDNRLQVQSP